MAFNSLIDFRAGAHDTMMMSTDEHKYPIRREVPSCYIDEIDHWVFEQSGWTGYGWDLSPEDETAFSRGKTPPNAFIQDASSSEPLSVPAEGEAQEMVEGTSGCTDPMDLGMMAEEINSLQADCMDIDLTTFSQLLYAEGVSLPDLQTAESQKDFETFFPSQKPVGSAMSSDTCVPSMNYVPQPYVPSSTPTLSPSSNSTCSLDEDLEAELFGTEPQSCSSNCTEVPEITLTNPFGTPEPQLDMNLFTQPFLADGLVSNMFFPPTPGSYQTMSSPIPIAVPELAYPLSFGKPTAMAQSPSPPPTPASSPRKPRRSTARSKRVDKPYTRKTSNSKHSVSREGGKEMICRVCGYVQAHGPGDVRSFWRHCETHPQYKVYEWRCRGVEQPDGTYYGGCNNIFSRRDALLRHLKTASVGCVSVIEPISIIMP